VVELYCKVTIGYNPRYIHENNSAAAWAVEDLSVYVSSFYHSVLHVGPTTVDFSMRRVRVRAAAYAMLDDRSEYSPHSFQVSGRGAL
jgi:hypothetical protein